jgi:hypothetical protein
MVQAITKRNAKQRQLMIHRENKQQRGKIEYLH